MRFALPAIATTLVLPLSALCAPKGLTPPPMGEDISARVMRGGSVEITLKAHEGRNNPLSYELGREPEHGRLENFRQADKNRQSYASVVYVHGDDEDSTEDEFAFRARALVGGGVSSPVKVKLRIVDAPPRLGIDPVVNFSAVAGESDTRQIIVANEGGGLLEGRLAPKEPFHVEGDGRFSLGRGQAKGIIVRFSPRSADSVAPQKLSPAPGDPMATTIFRGEAKETFTAAVEPMELLADGARRGGITVTNFASSPLKLALETEPPDAADVPRVAEIPAGASAEIPLGIAVGRESGAMDLRVRISSPHYGKDLAIAVPAVPPRLEVAKPELDFGEAKEASLEIRNTGGVAGRFTLDLPEGVQSLEGAANFAVPPGRSVEVRLRRESGSDLTGAVVTIDLGKQGKVPVTVVVAVPSPAPPPAQTATAAPPETPPQKKDKPWKLNRDVKLEKSADGRTRLLWTSGKSGWTGAKLEILDANGPREYKPAREEEGWWDSIVSWWSGRKVDESEMSWQSEQVPNQDLGNSGILWRISARSPRSGAREAVSDDFSVDTKEYLLVSAGEQPNDKNASREDVVSAPSPAPTPTTQKQLASAQGAAASRKIRALTVVSGRTHATVNIAVDADPNFTGFRVERCELVSTLDPATGMPRGATYQPVRHEGKISVLGVHPAESEGQKLSVVVAEIGGLTPGTVTMWRLVPLAGEEPLSPTGEFLVPTKPPWLFPRRGFFLSLLTAVLAAVLWLRHKRRRVAKFR